MQFMCFRKADDKTEASQLPTEAEIRAMGDYMEQLVKAGILRGGGGLKASSEGAKVRFREGSPTVIDGPFTETKELVAGWITIEVDSLADAVEWMKRWPARGNEANVEIEIRPIFADDDFGEEFTPELREREARLAAEAQEAARR